MATSVDIISPGTLSRNRFWNETGTCRPAHATTTLLRDGISTIIVDPSLPEAILRQRLDERTGLKPQDIDMVFLTNFRPIHRRALDLFQDATWLMHIDEIEAMRAFLDEIMAASDVQGQAPDELVEQESKLLDRLQAAPDCITEEVHLFPTPGVTPGAASLLVCNDDCTIAVAGDAVINREYFARGQAFEQHSNAKQAVQSMVELVEVADRIIPGHDDWILDVTAMFHRQID